MLPRIYPYMTESLTFCNCTIGMAPVLKAINMLKINLRLTYTVLILLLLSGLVSSTPIPRSMIAMTQRSVDPDPDRILGKWTNPDKDKVVEITKSGDAYAGTLVWMKDSSGHARVGEVVMDELKYEEGKWHGALHVNGRNATCIIEMPSESELKIRGKMGIISRTKVWTKWTE